MSSRRISAAEKGTISCRRRYWRVNRLPSSAPKDLWFQRGRKKIMTTRKVFASIAIAVAVALGATACAETGTRESTGQYIDGSVITTKVKTAIAKDDTLSVFAINVETYKDVVQLSGFVNTQAEKARAASVARGVEGVATVHNNLVVKPGSAG
jgi:osmotically-inducible protein OsmY